MQRSQERRVDQDATHFVASHHYIRLVANPSDSVDILRRQAGRAEIAVLQPSGQSRTERGWPHIAADNDCQPIGNSLADAKIVTHCADSAYCAGSITQAGF